MASMTDGLDMIEDVLAGAKKSQEDAISALKEQIKHLENQARQKSREYDDTSGGGKKIVEREIAQVFKEIDSKGGRQTIIWSNIEKLSLALESVAKLKASKVLDRLSGKRSFAGRIEQLRRRIVAANASDTLEGILDDIAVRMEEAYRDMEDADRAAKTVQDITYKAPESPDVDTTRRLDQTAVPATETLSPEIERRLKELEPETE